MAQNGRVRVLIIRVVRSCSITLSYHLYISMAIFMDAILLLGRYPTYRR